MKVLLEQNEVAPVEVDLIRHPVLHRPEAD